MTTTHANVYLGTAGWAMPSLGAGVPRAARPSALERYAREFGATEINTTFSRHHRPGTFAKWRASVPDGFRCSVKVPRALTHDASLRSDADALATMDRFLDEVRGLGDALGPLLVQLPPSLAFDPGLARAWFEALRERWGGGVVCEPRHVTWFDDAASVLLTELDVGRVGADPARVPAAADPGGSASIAYLRLHGSPRAYYSSYDDAALARLADRIRTLTAGARRAREVWCIFDNTASGAALGNARELRTLLGVA